MTDFNALRAALIEAATRFSPATDARGCYEHECAATDIRALHAAYTAFASAAIEALENSAAPADADAETFGNYMHDAASDCIPSPETIAEYWREHIGTGSRPYSALTARDCL
jgi:hypothetical protein